MAQVSVLLDVLIAGLLAATIFYAVLLNRKLGELRNNKAEMEAMVNRLVQTTERAEHGLAELKAAAHDKGEELSQKVSDAKALSDDLGFLVDKGTSLADRMERQIGAARKVTADPRGVEPMGLHEAAKPANTTARTAAPERAAPKPAANQPAEPAAEPRPDTGLRAEPRGTGARGGGQNAKLLKALRGVR
ncbi:MAG: DUF6468 domain-containing protein [Rhodovibrio sp.]|nr:DUF6468 domain-containing protein [Rhodovibrio sp.]